MTLSDGTQREKLTLSIEETAQLLGLGRNTTYALVNSGQLRSVRVGRKIIIPRDALSEFLARGA